MATVHVGLCEMTLRLFGIDSLKAKRGISRSLIARLHNRFNLSISEIGHQDSRERLGLALAAVSGSRAGADSVIAHAVQFVADDRRVVLETYSTTFV
jgi:uncharacterized protein YlxP (DUF503 family)